MRIINSNIATAFSEMSIGAKVTCKAHFYMLLRHALAKHDFSTGAAPGQAVLDLLDSPCQLFVDYPNLATASVVGGIGRKTRNPNDYVCRLYRGQVHTFLKREHAAPVKFLRAVVYTIDGYLNDPDVLAEPAEYSRAFCERAGQATHVLVALLAGEVESFVSPYRFVANLAGGNLEYAEGAKSYADLVSLAGNVKAFDDEWAVVAD